MVVFGHLDAAGVVVIKVTNVKRVSCIHFTSRRNQWWLKLREGGREGGRREGKGRISEERRKREWKEKGGRKEGRRSERIRRQGCVCV